MESNYGIGVNNRYALFFEQDDADGDEVLKVAVAPKPKASVAVPAAKKDVKPAPPSTQTAVKKPETAKPPRGEGRCSDCVDWIDSSHKQVNYEDGFLRLHGVTFVGD